MPDQPKDQRFDIGTYWENTKNFNVARIPCARDAFLNGIGGGAALGVLRFFQTRYIRKGCDTAVASFVIIGLASFEFCRYRRRQKEEEIREAADRLNEVQRKLAERDERLRKKSSSD